eukprot:1195675-Prorocentrum_minimum.AAC.2
MRRLGSLTVRKGSATMPAPTVDPATRKIPPISRPADWLFVCVFVFVDEDEAGIASCSRNISRNDFAGICGGAETETET